MLTRTKLMESLKLSKTNCRICLVDNVTIDWNEEISEFSGASYKDCYYKYTELQMVHTSDPFSSKLCEICSKGLKDAHLLFEKALESNKILNDTLTSKDIEEFDKETSKRQTQINFEVNYIIKDEILDNTLMDIEDEVLCPSNAYDNESEIVTEELPISENEINEDDHFRAIANSETTEKILLEHQLSQSSNEKPSVSSTTRKIRKMKIYLCAYCSLKCNDKSRLRIHEATHSENRKRTETCPHCGLKLYTKEALSKHIQVHDENREKKFKCEFCEKAFFNRGGLNIHRRIHLGQMLACRLCPKEFYRQVDLDKHLLRHSAAPLQKKVEQLKYTVQCQYCNEAVATRKWKGHKAAHLDQPQVKCKICDKDFFDRAKCVKHLNRLHRKTKDEYEECIHYYVDCSTRMSHLMIKQQEIMQPVTK